MLTNITPQPLQIDSNGLFAGCRTRVTVGSTVSFLLSGTTLLVTHTYKVNLGTFLCSPNVFLINFQLASFRLS